MWFASSGRVTARNEQGLALRMTGVCRDIDERKRAEIRAQRLAFYDPLTDLPNRRLMQDRLEQVTLTLRRNHRHGAFLFIDVDNFKTVNDTFGHQQGDALLRQLSLKLQEHARKGDTVARLGGDEFVVLLPDLDEDYQIASGQAESFARKLSVALDANYSLGAATYRATVSIGVAIFDGVTTLDIELPLREADMAMFQAKAEGKNSLRFYDPNMNLLLQQRVVLTNDLRHAVATGQFTLHYQPQVDGTGFITGVEALIRWRHPIRGMVGPYEFIPLAEELGLILPIGKWVLETACGQIAAWSKHPCFKKLTCSVNVSAVQLYQKDFVEVVSKALALTGANPEQLKLELTEGVLLKNLEDTVAKMHAMKTLGVYFSLDDFGTGFSSLSYLKRLPLAQLKIDQSFVREVLDDANDAAIARMIISLGQSLKLNVIAEGVETDAQRAFLIANGCSAFQGYLFGKPMPVNDLEGVVEAQNR